MSIDADAAVEDARVALDGLIATHRQAAIPTMLAVIVDWAVRHGGADVVRGSMNRALVLADELEAEHRKAVN